MRHLSEKPAAIYRRQLRDMERKRRPRVVICAVCGTSYRPKRAARQPEKRCCSDACKQRAYRERQQSVTPNGNSDI